MQTLELDPHTTRTLIETAVILLVGLSIFFGLKGRIQLFAERARLPRLAITPLRLGLRWSVLALMLFLIAGRWGFETQTILAVLGTALGLVAIGFVAVWSVLSNFLCTFVLIVVKPFCVGDEVELIVTNVKGKVIDLGFVFTTLEVEPGVTVMVPNNTFFQGPFRRRAGVRTVELDQQIRAHYPAEAAPARVA